MKTNLMHYLSLIYFVKEPLHVSGVYIAHHQDVHNVYVQQLVRVIRLGDWLLVWSRWNWFVVTKAVHIQGIPPDDGQ
jgi:hypothetical protein